MSERLLRIVHRIRDGLNELQGVLDRAQAGMQRACQTGDALYLDGVALNLHGFYAGLERLFELIAATVDGAIPQGTNWHQMLLAQMAAEVPSIRPAVISTETQIALDEYRGFRHVVRNVYIFNFEMARLQALVTQAPDVFAQTSAELLAFADFLAQCAEEGSSQLS